jgi:hypothetical protein
MQEDDFGKVAKCNLLEGRDIAELMVEGGHVLDVRKFSSEKYSQFAVAGIHKKLWLTETCQKVVLKSQGLDITDLFAWAGVFGADRHDNLGLCGDDLKSLGTIFSATIAAHCAAVCLTGLRRCKPVSLSSIMSPPIRWRSKSHITTTRDTMGSSHCLPSA